MTFEIRTSDSLEKLFCTARFLFICAKSIEEPIFISDIEKNSLFLQLTFNGIALRADFLIRHVNQNLHILKIFDQPLFSFSDLRFP
ncbi:hypothetical protein C6P79_21175 [Burkholderia multivorans]|nr:hypothetical protein C6P79_21175 [Burkholderia multivorans]